MDRVITYTFRCGFIMIFALHSSPPTTANRPDVGYFAPSGRFHGHTVELVHRFQHGHNVVHRCARLYVVNGVEHKTAVAREDAATFQNLLANLLRYAKWQHMLE